MFETTSYDFGTLVRGAKAEYAFIVTNIYAEEVRISDVRTSCGCTSVTIKEPLLRTYQQGAVVATINTRAFSGRRGATITVSFDKPSSAQVQLQVSCDIRNNVIAQPESVQLGNIDQGAAVTKSVSVGYVGSSDWRITEVISHDPHLSAEAIETGRSPNQVSYELRVHLAGDGPSGPVRSSLTVKTSDIQTPQFPILVEGQILPPIGVTPTSLYLGVLHPEQKVVRQVVLRGKKPFRIVAATSATNSLELNVSLENVARPLHVLHVTFAARHAPGMIAETVRIETDAGVPVLEVPVYAAVEK